MIIVNKNNHHKIISQMEELTWQVQLKEQCENDEAGDDNFKRIASLIKTELDIDTEIKFNEIYKANIYSILLSALPETQQDIWNTPIKRRTYGDKTDDEKKTARDRKVISTKISKWKKKLFEAMDFPNVSTTTANSISFNIFTPLHETLAGVLKKYESAAKKERKNEALDWHEKEEIKGQLIRIKAHLDEYISHATNGFKVVVPLEDLYPDNSLSILSELDESSLLDIEELESSKDGLFECGDCGIYLIQGGNTSSELYHDSGKFYCMDCAAAK